MKTIKGPAVFLAQFIGDEPPFNTLEGLCQYMSDLGYKGVQIPTWEDRLIDLKLAAESKVYCDELKGKVESFGLEITELSTHLQGQLVAVHPAYDTMFDPFAPKDLHGKPQERTKWATQQVKWGAMASRNLGLNASATFSGALLWPFFYLWPQRPAGLVEMGFGELADRWRPILDVYEEQGVDLCYELHGGEDIHDGVSFELFLEALDNHPRCCLNYDPSHFVLQSLDYVQFIDFYHERIKAFHVKDAEFNPDGRQGAYGGFQPWLKRAGRFRSLGDGQVDFGAIFSKLTQYDYDSWAVLEWECCIKSPEQGAKEGAPFIQQHIIEATEKAFDDFAGGATDDNKNRKILGL
jgi:sugar phosphate isomerase/epimerase